MKKQNTTETVLRRMIKEFPGMIFENYWNRLKQFDEKNTIITMVEILKNISRNVDNSIPTPEQDPDLHRIMELVGIAFVAEIYGHFPDTQVDEYIYQYIENTIGYEYVELAQCALEFMKDKEGDIVKLIINEQLTNQVLELELALYEEDEYYHLQIIDLFYKFRMDRKALQKHQDLFWYIADIAQDWGDEMRDVEKEKFEQLLKIFYSFKISFIFIRSQKKGVITMIDTHVHYDHVKYENDRKEVLETCREAGIKNFINCAITLESNIKMIEQMKSFSDIYFSIGIHPTRVGEYINEDEETRCYKFLQELSQEERVVAIGETGLDYHYKKDNEIIECQKRWFENHLRLAEEEKLPVVIHIREAYEDAIQILNKYSLNESGVVHCFSGTYKEAVIVTQELNLSIGIGTKVLDDDKLELKKIVKEIPLDKILLETDAPFLAVGGKKQRNTSLALLEVVKEIARIKEMSEREVIDITTKNAQELFRI